MDPDLENVIRQALGDALAAGKDHLGQTALAVQAVQRARPDMTASDALTAVNSPLKKASLTGFHLMSKHIAAKAVLPSSETMRTI